MQPWYPALANLGAHQSGCGARFQGGHRLTRAFYPWTRKSRPRDGNRGPMRGRLSIVPWSRRSKALDVSGDQLRWCIKHPLDGANTAIRRPPPGRARTEVGAVQSEADWGGLPLIRTVCGAVGVRSSE